jgi:hypothetical protein
MRYILQFSRKVTLTFCDTKAERKIAMKIEFSSFSNNEQHKCESFRDGDWIVFRCPVCQDYERRINWRTGDTKVKNSVPDINHSGSYFPYELTEAFINTN